MRINNNISAVITNMQLLRTEDNLSNVMERLSSGLKINHAADDPSGMAISGKMHTQIKGLNRASQNAGDGVNVIQTADGALSEVTNMLQRMRELAVQAANGLNSASEKEAIQTEINSLRTEIDRVSNDTEFNTKALLDGSLDTRVYGEHFERMYVTDSVTAGTYTITVDKASTQPQVAGGFIASSAGNVSVQQAGTVKINDVGVKITEGMSAQDVYEALRRGAEQAAVKLNESQDDPLTFTSEFYGKNSNLSITVDNDQLRQYLGIDAEVDGTYIPANASPVSTAQEGIIKINDTEVPITAGMTGDQVYSAIASAAAAEGITLSGNTDPLAFVSSNPFKISINNENLKSYLGISSTSYAVAKTVYGEDADVTLTRSVVTGTSVTVGFGKQATLAQDGNHFVISDTQGFEMNFSVEAGYVGDINMEVTDIGPMTLQIGANENQNMTVRIPSVSAEDMYLDKIDVTKSGGAERAIKTLDEAIARVSEIRSEMGAAQNRLETTVSSLDQTDENMNNAVSRIEDSDMAEEMTEYTKYNVLQQAATSVLSQANEIPQMALQLLQ